MLSYDGMPAFLRRIWSTNVTRKPWTQSQKTPVMQSEQKAAEIYRPRSEKSGVWA